MGAMINTIPCKIGDAEGRSVLEFVQSIQDAYVEAIPYSHIGLAQIQRWAGITGDMKLFQTNLVFENLPVMTELGSANALFKALPQDLPAGAFNDFAIQLVLAPSESSLSITADFDHCVVSKATVNKMVGYFDSVLTELCHALMSTADMKVSEVQRRARGDLQQLLDFGRGPVQAIPYECAHFAFEQLAQEDPQVVAVEHGDRNAKADRLAAHLVHNGVKPGQFVGIVTMRSIEMIVGIFAVLKAGGAYVPVDSELPLERISFILETAECASILCHPEIPAEVYSGLDQSKTISLAVEYPEASYVRPRITGDHPAYVVFTSGSTGKPKGVVIAHQSFTAIMTAKPNFLSVSKGSR
ncbi:MAG: hypothetical protein EAZ92_00875, partial [Candidatus Kapaibacterium sp.]